MSTVRSAIELKNVFEQLQAAEKAGNLTDEERRKLEEDAAEKGVKAMFKVQYSSPPPAPWMCSNSVYRARNWRSSPF